MLSIIIPTLNEEDYLPQLLASIKKQDFSSLKNSKDKQGYEVIVADAGSTDATLKIAKKYGCKIIGGGLPARGRNNGAKVAKGDLLLFLDADGVLPDNFLKNTLEEFTKRNLDMASFAIKPNPKNAFESFLLTVLYDNMIVALEKVLPHAAMGILIKKELFKKLKGYDETITLAEDHDLARRAARQAKFGIIRSTELLVSTRRFKKDGWLATGIKFFLCELHMVFIGPVKSDIFKYKFNHYKESKPIKK